MFTLHEGSFPKKEMEKLQERLTKTIRHIFGKIVKNVLIPEDKEDKEASPYELTEYDIERNGTMCKKTINILRCAGVLPAARNKVNKYYSMHSTLLYNYEQLFKEYSEEYAIPLEFPVIPDSLRLYFEDTNAAYLNTELDNLNTYGYKDITVISDAESIYVYHHQDLYDIIRKSNNNTVHKDFFKVYPKTMLESRIKAVLKALMRKYCEGDLLSYLKKKFDIDFTGQIITKEEWDDEFKITIRNFTRYPSTFNKHCFSEAKKSFAKEYHNNITQINFEYERLKNLSNKINVSGGCKAVLEGYIKESVDKLVSKAPTLINGNDADKDALVYILDHRDIITWDYLYN